ncbi:MAG TPA: FkbM family methyltransferase [Conexibacter sp.]|nr:FkbM family methyltransferase [Conexibacter sp.]
MSTLVADPPVSAHDAFAAAAAAERDALRARFLQVVLEAQRSVLPDNLDPLFHPWGHALPDASQAGERLAAQLAILDRCTTLWRRLGDEHSRELFLRFLAYRALGPAHVRLQYEALDYRRAIVELSVKAIAQAGVLGVPGLPLEWHFHVYDMSPAGYPLRVIGQQLPLASTFVLSQYAYRELAVGAFPRPGDIALDVGGCWGDTALWLAHHVGEQGQVHTFEPTPRNRALLQRNLELNPQLVPRVTVWEDPLAPVAGETVWVRDTVSAGAQMQGELPPGDDPHGRETVALRTETIDALVERGALPRVDFLKVDVEGADVGVLEGAAQTLVEQRPRLALACYHKPDDLVRIPDLIAELGLAYRWYLQCSTMTPVDTVLFGVPVVPGR